VGFRNPITTAEGVDTGESSTGPGVRMYQDEAGDPNFPTPRGVVEFRDGIAGDEHATITRTVYVYDDGTGFLQTFGGVFDVDAGSVNGVDAGRLRFAVEEDPMGGWRGHATLTAQRFTLQGRQEGWAYARLIQTAAVPGLLAGWRALAMQGEVYDPWNGHTGSNAFWTVPAGQDGLYEIEGICVFAAHASNPLRNSRLLVNGAVFAGCAGFNGNLGVNNGNATTTGVKDVELVAGNTVSLEGYSSLDWGTAVFPDACSQLRIRRVR
jgi:hypothetical protein